MSRTSKMDNLDSDGPTPTLHFPEFDDGDAWQRETLRRLASPVKDKATGGDNEDTLTLSGEMGLVPQGDYFGKQISGENVSRYIKIVRDDFVYNDRTTKASKFGSIKRLTSTDGGIVSPIYKCFRFKGGQKPDFWDYYFEAQAHEAQLGVLVNEGARAGRFNISIDKFLSIDVWKPSSPEQERIAECLASIDALIEAETEKLDLLKDHKQGLMQQLFPAEGESLPVLRFPEFRLAGAWTEKAVSELFEVTRGRVLAMTLVSETKTDQMKFPVYSSQTKRRGLCGYYSEYLYQDAITWTTDGAGAGDVNFRPGQFFCTNVCGVLLSKQGFANPFMAALLSRRTRSHVSYHGNPKLMNGVMGDIVIPVPTLPEQQRISSLLVEMDSYVENQEAKIEQLNHHKMGLLQQLFPVFDEVQG